jgi:site-specific recombinase XerD
VSGSAAGRRSPAVERGFHTGREPANKGRTYPVEILSEDEVKALIRACSARAPTGIRNRALITVLYRGGLRLSEALALQPKDIDSTTGSITVLRGKGGKRRTVGLDPGASALLERWIERRSRLGIGGRRPLFCTLQGRPLKSSYIRTLLPRLARKVGIEKRVHPHGLRHTHAAELAAERIAVNLVQQQLGHASLAATDRYLRHIAPVELIQALQTREWSPPEDG